MKILITGAKGFIGKNLINALMINDYNTIYEYDIDSDASDLIKYTADCDFVFHLAGINRPKDDSEYMKGNFGFTNILIDALKQNNNNCPIMVSSSIKAESDTPYGKSKRAGEDLLFDYQKETGVRLLVYRFPNVFGKWCSPNYNSAVATFSYNIANDLPITINDPDIVLNLIYIDDLVSELIRSLTKQENKIGRFCYVEPVYEQKLGEIADLLYSFKNARKNLSVPDMSDSFIKKLYANYLSYLPINQFSYNLLMNIDERGSFTEFLKTKDRGQISVNISKPEITKGNHWHNTKNEKFLVVFGTGVIRFRKVNDSQIIEYFVSGEKLQVIDIPPGYTHNISNLGDTDLVTIMWANENYNPDKPDTFFMEV